MSIYSITKFQDVQSADELKESKEVEAKASASTSSLFQESIGSNLCTTSPLSLLDSLKDDYKNTPLYKAYSPLMFSLKLTGLHYLRQIGNEDRSCCGLPSASQVYTWTVTIVNWILVVRCLATLRLVEEFGPEMLGSISCLTWFLLSALNATAFLKASHFPKNIRKFFRGFTKLNRYGGSFVCPIRTRKYIIYGTITTWFVVFINYAVICYLVYGTKFFDLMTTGSFTEEDTVPYLTLKTVYCFFMFYLTVLWIFPSIMQLAVSIVIYREFSLFRESFHTKISKEKRYVGDSLELDRRRFLQMLRIVEAADGCLSLHQSAAFICNIVNMCLLLYNTIYYPDFVQDPVVAAVNVFWFIYDAADIGVVIISGVLINSSVSCLLHDDYLNVNINKYTYKYVDICILYVSNMYLIFYICECKCVCVQKDTG